MSKTTGKIKIALAGVGGYGGVYLDYLERYVEPEEYVLTGVIDPFAASARHYEWLKANHIPVYDTLEEFYAGDYADLMIISTPVRFHKPQSITAMKNGSHVLCEKPLVPVIQDVTELKQAQEKYGRKFGVGFQLSFSPPILELKRDIIKGEFGSPIEMKHFSSWRRYDDYYDKSDWKGRIKSQNGEWILDAVSTNATAHYLFNIFFMSGDKIETSAMPVNAQADLYRAKNIETYDTCFIRGAFANGCKFFYFSTHSGKDEINPLFSYKFENAVVTMNDDGGKYEITAKYNDGRVKNYGDALSGEYGAQKIRTMISAVKDDAVIPCGIDTVIPHVVISNAIFDQAGICGLPKDILFRTEAPSPPGTFVRGLLEQATKCYNEMKFPAELGCEWAAAPFQLTLDGYTAFSGEKYK